MGYRDLVRKYLVHLQIILDALLTNATDSNKMKKLNDEIRKMFRCLKNLIYYIICMKIYYNSTKKHGDLKGVTPIDAALIKMDVNKVVYINSKCLIL